MSLWVRVCWMSSSLEKYRVTSFFRPGMRLLSISSVSADGQPSAPAVAPGLIQRKKSTTALKVTVNVVVQPSKPMSMNAGLVLLGIGDVDGVLVDDVPRAAHAGARTGRDLLVGGVACRFLCCLLRLLRLLRVLQRVLGGLFGLGRGGVGAVGGCPCVPGGLLGRGCGVAGGLGVEGGLFGGGAGVLGVAFGAPCGLVVGVRGGLAGRTRWCGPGRPRPVRRPWRRRPRSRGPPWSRCGRWPRGRRRWPRTGTRSSRRPLPGRRCSWPPVPRLPRSWRGRRRRPAAARRSTSTPARSARPGRRPSRCRRRGSRAGSRRWPAWRPERRRCPRRPRPAR